MGCLNPIARETHDLSSADCALSLGKVAARGIELGIWRVGGVLHSDVKLG